ncbi:MAG: MerR family transcriptional regulator [Chloroflexota bacterium]
MVTYKTTEIARIIGIHANTVRLYEELGLIPEPARKANGYRIFTEVHIEQFRLARLALRAEVTQNGLRKKAIDIIKTSASSNYEKAIELTELYLAQVKIEQSNAEEAIEITKQLLSNSNKEGPELFFTRQEAADYLHITIDTLRNWELNGLLAVKRKKNGYRIYNNQDIQRLKIIRTLRCANYSLSSILRMLQAVSVTSEIDLRVIIDTPQDAEDIVSVCDRLLTSLSSLERDAHEMIDHLKKMKTLFIQNPPL